MRVTGDQIYMPDPYLGSTLKPGAQCYIERRVSREHVYTNSRGWRCPVPREAANPREIALIGCSWPMGVGVEYEQSFAGKFTQARGVNIANLGVGSYSLLQATRRLEREIAFIRPKTVLLSYGHWLVDRCFKSNAMGNIIMRPLYKKNRDGKLFIEEPNQAPAQWIESYTRMQRRAHDKGLGYFENTYLKALYQILFLHTRRYGMNAFSKSTYVDPSDGDSYFIHRQEVLNALANRLQALCSQHGARLFVFHLHQYTKHSDIDERCIMEDIQTWQSFAGLHENVYYESPTRMAKALEQYARALQNGTTLLDSIHLPDNNHPNAAGHALIAAAINAAYNEFGFSE